MHTQQQFNELLALTQSYLLQEHPIKEWICTDSDNYTYFKQMALASKASAPASLPSQISPPRSTALTPPEVPLRSTPPPQTPPPPTPPPKAATKSLPSNPVSTVLEEKQISPLKALFDLEPMGKPKPADFSEMRKTVAEKLPKLVLKDQIPEKRSRISPARQAHVIVLADSSNVFLPNVVQAITAQLAPAILLDPALIEREGVWEALASSPCARLLLIDDLTLRAYPNLLKHYRPAENAQGGILGRIPAMILSDLLNLAADPVRKRALWNALKTALAA